MVQNHTYHAGEQVAQWDFQNKGRSKLLCFGSPIVQLTHLQRVILYHVIALCKGPIWDVGLHGGRKIREPREKP